MNCFSCRLSLVDSTLLRAGLWSWSQSVRLSTADIEFRHARNKRNHAGGMAWGTFCAKYLNQEGKTVVRVALQASQSRQAAQARGPIQAIADDAAADVSERLAQGDDADAAVAIVPQSRSDEDYVRRKTPKQLLAMGTISEWKIEGIFLDDQNRTKPSFFGKRFGQAVWVMERCSLGHPESRGQRIVGSSIRCCMYAACLTCRCLPYPTPTLTFPALPLPYRVPGPTRSTLPGPTLPGPTLPVCRRSVGRWVGRSVGWVGHPMVGRWVGRSVGW